MSTNVALIGFGKGFNTLQYHYNTIRKIKGFNLYGVCDTSKARRKKVPSTKINTFNCFEKVLSDDKIDLIVIATPNNTHAPLTIKALNSGKNVVVEKPMALNTKEVDDMISAAKKNNLLLSVRQNRRWDSDYLTVKRVIDDNLLGEIFLIDSSINMYIKPSSWRAKKEAGGGFLLDWGSHLFDQIIMLTQSEPVRVYAIIKSLVWDVDVDTHSRVLTSFKNGVNATVDVSNVSRINRPRWHIQGDKGALIYKNNKAIIRTSKGTQEVPKTKGDLNEFYQNILDSLENNAELIVKPEDIRKSIAILEAAFISAKKGESIVINS